MKRREFLGILGVSPMVALLRKIPNKNPEGERIFDINWISDEEMEIRYYGGIDFGFPAKWMEPGDMVLLDESGRFVQYPAPDYPYEDSNWKRVIGIVKNVDNDFVDISIK